MSVNWVTHEYMLDVMDIKQENLIALFVELIGAYARACKKRSKWKLCEGCKTVYYCSRKCQKISWKHRHKQQCQKLQKLIAKIDSIKINIL